MVLSHLIVSPRPIKLASIERPGTPLSYTEDHHHPPYCLSKVSLWHLRHTDHSSCLSFCALVTFEFSFWHLLSWIHHWFLMTFHFLIYIIPLRTSFMHPWAPKCRWLKGICCLQLLPTQPEVPQALQTHFILHLFQTIFFQNCLF